MSVEHVEQIGYVVSGTGVITLVLNGNTYTVDKSHMNYEKIKTAIKDSKFEELEGLLDITKSIKDFSCGQVIIKDGVVSYNGVDVQNSITRRIISLNQQGFPFEPVVRVLDNLMNNTSKRAVDETYTFLEFNNLPITEDGCFLAYKRVRDDFTDFRTGKIDNKIGTEVSMPRNAVCDNKDLTCSAGLHVCSLEYLKNFHSGIGHIIIVKVNPADVVSVPVDYNNSKMRVCKYKVIGEHKGIDAEKTEAFDKPLYDENGDDAKDTKDTKNGYDKYGYDANGYNKDGYDVSGFDQFGYDKDGFDDEGFGRDGYDCDGYDCDGWDIEGYDRDGWNKDGFNPNGYDRYGYDELGFDTDGFNRDGWNRAGYDRDGFDRDGWNDVGYSRDGVRRAGLNG